MGEGGAKVCEAARKAGADRVIVDGVVIVLSPAAAAPESSSNEASPFTSAVTGRGHLFACHRGRR